MLVFLIRVVYVYILLRAVDGLRWTDPRFLSNNYASPIYGENIFFFSLSRVSDPLFWKSIKEYQVSRVI